MLKGSSSHIDHIINNFKNNTTKVLLLNPKYYGTGLNLEMCTDIIVMHQMEQDIYNQMLGVKTRKQRLNIYHLCNSNEL